MNRRKEVILACFSIGLTVGMLAIIGWSISAGLNHHRPPGAWPIFGLCFGMAALGAMVGMLRQRRHQPAEPALLTYGPFQIGFVMIGPILVTALGVSAALKPVV